MKISSKQLLVCLSGLGLLAFLIYSNSFEAGFYFDDKDHIPGNPFIRSFSKTGLLWQFFRHRFVSYISFAADYQIWGLNPYGYHVTNVMVHIATGWMVYLLMLATLRTPAMKDRAIAKISGTAALITALIFISHPLQTQSVVYTVQRSATLAALFYLATLVLYAHARLKGCRKCLAAAVITALIAFFCKQNAYTLPFAVLLYEFIFFGKEKNILVRIKGAALLCIPLGFVYWVCYHTPIAEGGLEAVSRAGDIPIARSHYLMTQINVLRTYLRLLVVPYPQNFDPDYPITTTLINPATLASLALLAGLVLTGFLLRKRNPLIAFGIFWFFITLAVESSILPISDVIFEHRLYLPMFGYAAALVSVLHAVMKNKNIFSVVCGILVIVFSLLAHQRNAVWKNEFTLWTDVIQKSPNKARGYINLGLAFREIGQPGKGELFIRKFLKLDPEHPQGHNALGVTAFEQKRYDEAIRYFNKALELHPGYVSAIRNLGLVYTDLQETDKAVEYYEEAIRLQPYGTETYVRMGVLYNQNKEYDRAEPYLKKALDIDPTDDVPWNSLGIVYYMRGDNAAAKRHFQRSLNVRENYDAYYNMGLVSRRENKMKQADEYFRKASRLKEKTV